MVLKCANLPIVLVAMLVVVPRPMETNLVHPGMFANDGGRPQVLIYKSSENRRGHSVCDPESEQILVLETSQSQH